MEVGELRSKSAEELKGELVRLRKEQFGFRMDQASGQLAQSHLLKETRRDIARIKMVLGELANASPAASE